MRKFYLLIAVIVMFLATACSLPIELSPQEWGMPDGPKVKLGMTAEEVLKVLGQPEWIEKGAVTRWVYSWGGTCSSIHKSHRGPGEQARIKFDQGLVVGIHVYRMECDEKT